MSDNGCCVTIWSAVSADVGTRIELADDRRGEHEGSAHARRQQDARRLVTRGRPGRFSKPGSDIEMLQTLRQRVPLVGDEMSEAYVGRRMVGHSVEVAFVSAWQRLPTDRVLEESFWSDIALRYDEFFNQKNPAQDVKTARALLQSGMDRAKASHLLSGSGPCSRRYGVPPLSCRSRTASRGAS